MTLAAVEADSSLVRLEVWDKDAMQEHQNELSSPFSIIMIGENTTGMNLYVYMMSLTSI